MHEIYMKVESASFTVEAVFVMSITIWIVIALCYFSMYTHDQTAIYSLAENHMERKVENGKDWTKKDIEVTMLDYLQKHMMITNIKSISVQQSLLCVKAAIQYDTKIRIPFVQKLFSAVGGGTVEIRHELLFAPYYMWDSEVVKKVIGGR